MMRYLILTTALLASSSMASTPELQCPSDLAIDQAQRLLAFHSEGDERIEIAPDIEYRPSITNPANPEESFQVIEVWGYIYRAQYRMRLIYYPMQDGCILMGQEVLEHASLGQSSYGPDPMPPASGIVRELTLGDRACYMMIEDEGDLNEAMAVMHLCERDDLIDQFATFGHDTGEIIAMQCEGDPECTDYETVLLINSATLESNLR